MSVLERKDRNNEISIEEWQKNERTNLTEDDALPDRQKLVEGNKDIVFMLFIPAIHVKLLDVVDAEFFFLQLDLVGVWGEFGCKGADIIRERGGEKDNLEWLFGKEAFECVSASVQ